MTRQVNLYEAKTNLSQLVEDAAKGEEIIIAKNGKPMVKMVAATVEANPQKRVFGQLKGKVWLADDFDAADVEIERLFYEGDLNDPPVPFKHE
jgi:prevent-host-death family protein